MYTKFRILCNLYPSSTNEIRASYNAVKNSLNSYSMLKEMYELKAYAKKSMQNLFYGDNFELRKKQLIQDIRKAGFWGIGDLIAKKISKIKKPAKLIKIYENMNDFINNCIQERRKVLNKTRKINYKKLFNPFKLDERLDECFGKIITSFYRFLTPITQKPAILKIETAIKKMGVKEVRLGNNIEDAQNIYKAVKIAFNNHDILPTHIFVPIFPENIHSSSKAFFEAYTKNNKIIVYAPEKRTKLLQNINQERLNKLEKSKDFSNLSPTMQDIAGVLLFNKKFSTNVPCGVMLHEIGHANQKIYLPQMSLLDLTEKDALTIQKLTNYCYHDDVLSEAFAELYAKLRAHGVEALTKDELNLWKRMNSGYFTSYEKKLIRKLIKDKNSY